MPDLPFPITAENLPALRDQIHRLILEIFEERIGGAQEGDVFEIGNNGIFTLKLAVQSGLKKIAAAVAVLPKTNGGIAIDDDGVYADPSTIDHGGLAGLPDDDHAQYVLADGTRVMEKLTVGGANNIAIDVNGNLVFVGGAGLAFGEIYAHDVANELTITAAGQANKVQITSFTVNGASNNTTPDHTNDHITITKAGKYLCTFAMAISSAAAGGADEVGFAAYKNNGTTEFLNLCGHRTLSGGGTDRGSCSGSGIIDLSVSDTIEVWIWNEDSTDNIVVDDITLTLVQIGG